MPAVMFGSISTVADTSELQRRSFNEAFQAHGLDWEWSREDYLELLEQSGGQQRIADYAAGRGRASTPRRCTRRSPRSSNATSPNRG